MHGTRKRPCRICQRWFYPDSRAGSRQRACSNPACQAARRRKTQAKWRAANPGYAVAYRIDQRHANPAEEPEPLRVPAPLKQLPWDFAKDQFGGKGVDFIAVLSTLLHQAAKDQSRRYPIDPMGDPRNNPTSSRKTRSQPPHTESRGAASTGVSSTGLPPGAPPGPPPGPFPAAVGLTG